MISSKCLLGNVSVRIILRNNHLTKAHRVFSFSRPTLSALQPNNKDRSWSQYAQTIINNKEINTIPNIITISRIIASPLISVAIAQDMKYAALGGCVVFGLTDWLDGYLAKRLNQRTVLGAFLDPMADKVLIGALTLGLVVKGLIPVSLACVILGRDAVLVGASFALRAIEKPPDAAFFDTTDSATFDITPSILSKINTGVQFTLLSATLANFAAGVPSIEQLEPLWWITATTTISSGLMYLDGSGRKKITRTVKDKVDVQVKVVKRRVNDIIVKTKLKVNNRVVKFRTKHHVKDWKDREKMKERIRNTIREKIQNIRK